MFRLVSEAPSGWGTVERRRQQRPRAKGHMLKDARSIG